MSIGDFVLSLLRKATNNRVILGSTIAVVLFCSAVPVVLATENWDDHDRSGRYMARDIGRNYLNSAPQNAIIINFGDNDTFPLWYCQEVEGIRTDVRVMNSSYLGGEWYIDEMKLAANDAKAVPFTIPSTKYSYVNDWALTADVIEVLDTEKARRLRTTRRRIEGENYYQIPYTDAFGQKNYISGTYSNVSAKIKEAQDILDEYTPILEQYISEGDTSSDGFYDVYVPYAVARSTMEAILNDDAFMTDYEDMEEYWAYNDLIANNDILLKDAIRLFVSDEQLTLAINNGRMVLLAEGETIPKEERGEDYIMVGRLKTKVDSYFDGLDVDYILMAKSYIIPVDKDNAIASGIINESEAERAVDEIRLSLKGKSMVTKDHLMILDLLANFNWERPISFTQAHIMKDYGIVDYARFDGYCLTFVPIYTRYRSGAEAGYINADELYPLFMANDPEVEPLYFGNLADEDVLVDYFYRYNVSASRIRESFARVASEYIRRGGQEDILRAEALLDRGLEVLPSHKIGFSHSNTQPYIRGYYTLANYYLESAIYNLERANAKFEELLGLNAKSIDGEDNFAYFYALSDAAAEYHATATHRGLNCGDITEDLQLSDDNFARSEELFRKGDTLAAQYIKQRGEWVNYYLQYATYDSFSFDISDELYNRMLDILETLNLSHLTAGSFEWVANGDAEDILVENPLNFDALAVNYLKAIQRLMPDDANAPEMALIEGHICNLYEIYSTLPLVRVVDGAEVYAPYLDDIEDLLETDTAYEVLTIYGKI